MGIRLARLATFTSLQSLRRSRSLSVATTHRLMAEDALAAGAFAKARRHLRIACRISPGEPDLLAALARAWEDDPHGSDERAFRWYRRAVKLQRGDALLLARFGRSAIRVNQQTLAIKAIRKAARLAPADAAVLEVIRDACRELGKLRYAEKLIGAARFLAPRDAAIQSLWRRVQFDLAACRQSRRQAHEGVVPFLRVVHGSGSVKLRWDGPAVIKAHF